jgi:N-acylglucosamine-6-phosphate 2-epimerase
LHNNLSVLEKIKGGLVVSCQALEGEPLYGTDTMVKMANAAYLGGAVGIRANSTADVKAIVETVNLPVIGIIKRDYKGSECYITPTMREVSELIEGAKPHIIAVDGTKRVHPNGILGSEFIAEIRKKYPEIVLMADISTVEEAVEAEAAGADLVSTTLSGYTGYSPHIEGPDFELIERCSERLSIPILGEGRIWSPEEAKKALESGAYAIVIGSAITRPMEITKRFTGFIKV